MKLIEVHIAAKRLSVSETTIRRMIVDPDSPLEAVRVSKKLIRVTAESLERCMNQIYKPIQL